MKGIERHKAIHMLSGPSAGYLALIIRCRFYFLLLHTSRWVSFCAIMLPHAGPLYHANARSSFCENNTTKPEDRSAYCSPPVHTARETQSRLNCEARAKILLMKLDSKTSLSIEWTDLIRNAPNWVNGLRFKSIAARLDKLQILIFTPSRISVMQLFPRF